MSLAQITYPPPTEWGMEEWFQAHARHHEAIVGAVKETFRVQLSSLGLYPVNPADLTDWLLRHQQMHQEMNSLLNIAGTDLTGLNLKDKNASDAWFFQHFLQHQSAGELCGMSI